MINSRKQVLSNEPTQQKPLRLWPGVVLVILQWLIRFGLPLAVPADIANQIGVFGGILFGLFIILWWAFFSRAPRVERWGGIILMIVSLLVSASFIHVSISTAMNITPFNILEGFYCKCFYVIFCDGFHVKI